MTEYHSRWALLNAIAVFEPEDLERSATYRSTTIYFRQDTGDETFDIRIPGLTSASQVVVFDNLESAIHAVKSLDTLIDWWQMNGNLPSIPTVAELKASIDQITLDGDEWGELHKAIGQAYDRQSAI